MSVRRRHAFLISATLLGAMLSPAAPAIALETAPPATRHATVTGLPAAVTAQGAPAGVRTSAPVPTTTPFTMIGFRLPTDAEAVRVRTRDLDGIWSSWTTLEVEEPGTDGPDLDTDEARNAHPHVTEPLWVGGADAFQVVYAGDLSQVTADLIDTLGLHESTARRTLRRLTPRPVAPSVQAEAAAARPAIISRTQWGANESWRRGSPSYASRVTFGVVHHTAGSNGYSRAEAPAVLRGIYSYHTRTLGWSDIGYNIVVDRYGQIYEGRAGGLERGVIGAHAAGFNTGSFGVAVMGNFETVDLPHAAFDAVARVAAWKFGVHGIDPQPDRTISVNGRTIRPLVGHRDVGSTLCPGRYFAAKMTSLRQRVQALTSEPTRFSDVGRSHTHYDVIEDVAERGIAYGCAPGRYCPSRTLTRAEMASFLQRAFEVPDAPGHAFTDLGGTAHAGAIAAIAAAGLTQGCRENAYCPEQPVTRAQMAAFLQRALDLAPTQPAFHDARSHQQAGAIGAVATAGIAAGHPDGTFRPNLAVNRAQMAAFLSRALAD